MRYSRAFLLIGLACLLLGSGCVGRETPSAAQSGMTEPAGQGPAEPVAPGIASQVIPNWNVSAFADSPECMHETVKLRVSLLADGTITHVEPQHSETDGPCFDRLADSAKRAFLMTRRLQLPPGKTYQAITFIFGPSEMR